MRLLISGSCVQNASKIGLPSELTDSWYMLTGVIKSQSSKFRVEPRTCQISTINLAEMQYLRSRRLHRFESCWDGIVLLHTSGWIKCVLILHRNCFYPIEKICSQSVGLEPTLPEGIWFLVRRLNHSATTAPLLLRHVETALSAQGSTRGEN